MRRLWMCAAGLLTLAACREENKDRALGTERHEDQGRIGTTADERAKTGEAAKDRDALATARILATIQAFHQEEIDSSKLAQQKASSPDVKSYANKLVTEHQKGLDDLNKLAKDKKIDLSMSGVGDDPILAARKDATKKSLDHLRGLSGEAFDAAYMMAQPSEHEVFVQIAQQGQKTAKDADVKSYLGTMARVGEDHRQGALNVMPRTCGGQEAAGWSTHDTTAPPSKAGQPGQRPPAPPPRQP